jgi:hypothetical protein
MSSPVLLALVVLVAVGTTVAALVQVIRTSTRRAPFEAGLTPLYSDRGGGTFGLVRISAPLVRIAVYPTQLVIAHLSTLVIPADAIREVSIVPALIGRRVRLVHGCSAFPSPVLLWSNTPEALAAAIRGIAPHAAAAG